MRIGFALMLMAVLLPLLMAAAETRRLRSRWSERWGALDYWPRGCCTVPLWSDDDGVTWHRIEIDAGESR